MCPTVRREESQLLGAQSFYLAKHSWQEPPNPGCQGASRRFGFGHLMFLILLWYACTWQYRGIEPLNCRSYPSPPRRRMGYLGGLDDESALQGLARGQVVALQGAELQ